MTREVVQALVAEERDGWYVVISGWHRIQIAKKQGYGTILCEVMNAKNGSARFRHITIDSLQL